ncbi:hypothetical protein BB559_002735 [Furculomyces boomerangus]|uniref:Dephospho-CoA kinase n=1 Tax=Furculomyces boomerangus TaxID=61424 RepID=A0A2T9YT23_9FUNG|nr:hypothetical protein BB559_002735 [Furculomyces boomerangus]
MLIIGLTGGISTGKSTISNHLRKKGIPIVDADLIARQIMEPGARGYNLVLKNFGKDVLLQNSNQIDRKKLGEIIFRNVEKRQLLNRCTHPAVRTKMLSELLGYYIRGYPMCVLDVPLLFEGGLHRYCNKVVVVSSTEQIQLERLMKRDGITEEQAMSRIEAQMPLSEKRKLADMIIENNGTIENTINQVDTIINKIKPSKFKVIGALLAPLGICTSIFGMFIPGKFSLALGGFLGSTTLFLLSISNL